MDETPTSPHILLLFVAALLLVALATVLMLLVTWRRYNKRIRAARDQSKSDGSQHIDIWQASGKRLMVPLPKPPHDELDDDA